MRKLALVVVGSLAGSVPAVFSAPGDLDPSFGAAGKVTTTVGDSHAFAHALVLQPDGKLVAAGQAVADGRTYMTLVRYDAGGMLDPTFGTGGKVMTPVGTGDAAVYALVLQPDGKLVGAGHAGGEGVIAVARWNAEGTLDPSFGVGGTVTTNISPSTSESAQALVLQSDGKLVTAGYTNEGNTAYQFALVRYLADGSLDPTFGLGGKVTTSVGGTTSLALGIVQQADGKLVAAGYWSGYPSDPAAGGPALVRYDVDGQLDPTFGIGGMVTSAGVAYVAQALLLQPDGKLVAAGSSAGPDFTVARYSDGTLDATFGTAGQVTTDVAGFDEARAIVRQSDGKLVVAGSAYPGPNTDLALARYDADGQLDPSFGIGGTLTTAVGTSYEAARAVLQQPDEKLVVAGYFYDGDTARFALVRYLGGGPCDDVPCTTTTTTLPCGGDADGDGIGDACDPCTNDGTRDATKARLTAARLQPPAGDDVLKLSGVVAIPAMPPIDPVADGIRLVYGDRAGVIVDDVVPPGAYDGIAKVGWIAKNGSFKYVNRAGTSAVRKLVVKAIASTPGAYKVQVTARYGTYAIDPEQLPARAIVVLDPPLAATGQCGEWTFPATPPASPSCAMDATASVLKCK